MDDDIKAAVFAHMQYRVVASRRRELRETIALRLFRLNGTVTAAEVDDAFALEWFEPDGQEIADIAARKAEAAAEYHRSEAAQAIAAAEVASAKATKLRAQADQADAAVADAGPAAEEALERADTAAEVLAYAEASGAVAARAPSGADAVANAQVADAVGDAGTLGGN